MHASPMTPSPAYTQRSSRSTPALGGTSPALPPLQTSFNSMLSSPIGNNHDNVPSESASSTPVIAIGDQPGRSPGRAIRKRNPKSNDAYDVF
jgi:hypothetical protein